MVENLHGFYIFQLDEEIKSGQKMKNKESNFLLYGLIVGGILSTGLVIYLGSRFISKTNKNLLERRHKFFEGIDDIFDEGQNYQEAEDPNINKETEDEIIDELFSRTN